MSVRVYININFRIRYAVDASHKVHLIDGFSTIPQLLSFMYIEHIIQLMVVIDDTLSKNKCQPSTAYRSLHTKMVACVCVWYDGLEMRKFESNCFVNNIKYAQPRAHTAFNTLNSSWFYTFLLSESDKLVFLCVFIDSNHWLLISPCDWI